MIINGKFMTGLLLFYVQFCEFKITKFHSFFVAPDFDNLVLLKPKTISLQLPIEIRQRSADLELKTFKRSLIFFTYQILKFYPQQYLLYTQGIHMSSTVKLRLRHLTCFGCQSKYQVEIVFYPKLKAISKFNNRS